MIIIYRLVFNAHSVVDEGLISMELVCLLHYFIIFLFIYIYIYIFSCVLTLLLFTFQVNLSIFIYYNNYEPLCLK